MTSGWPPAPDRGARSWRQIQAPSAVLRLAVEETAQAERSRGQRVHRAVEQQIARLAGAELPVGAFCSSSSRSMRLRSAGFADLALVLQGDVLRAIVAVANLEAGAAAIDLQLLGPACRQRDADDGDPALAILAHHQGRLALIAQACGALGSLPSSITATPPGTGLFSRRVMKPSAWAGNARERANSRAKTRDMDGSVAVGNGPSSRKPRARERAKNVRRLPRGFA